MVTCLDTIQIYVTSRTNNSSISTLAYFDLLPPSTEIFALITTSDRKHHLFKLKIKLQNQCPPLAITTTEPSLCPCEDLIRNLEEENVRHGEAIAGPKKVSAELLAEVLKQRELNAKQEDATVSFENRVIKQEKEMIEFHLRL